jgi:hypothetical protein
MGRRVFPPEVCAFFEANNYGRSSQEMTDLLNATFGANYTRAQIKCYRTNHHLNSGLTGRFEKGHEPYNKGQKRGNLPGMERTQFKPGHMPHNHRPVGSERVNRDGYRERKIAEPKTWRAVHVLNWEAAHGPVPKGHKVIFKDGNRANPELANLLLVSNGDLAVMNKRGLCSTCGEATEAGLVLARYIKAVTKARKERRKK